MKDNKQVRMINQVIPCSWLPWDVEPEETDKAYDLLWSHVPQVRDGFQPYTVAELQGNLIRAIIMGIKWGAKNAEAIRRRTTYRSDLDE